MVLALGLLRFWLLCHLGGVGVETVEMKTLSVMEGDSVTLHTDVSDIQGDTVIEWMFGAESPDIVIAEINRAANINSVHDERFRVRGQMDIQTGSLTITNIKTTHSGLYKLDISAKKGVFKMFRLTVYARLPVPVIIRNSSQCSSSSESSSVSKCVLECSVVNVSHVTLSWYKGNSVLSNISVSNFSTRLSLPLEVEYREKNPYSCVINNPISNQTTHLDSIMDDLNIITQLCQQCTGITNLIVLICAAAGTLLIVAAVAVFWICRKCRKTDQEVVQAPEKEITYAEPTFCKRNAQRTRGKQEDEVVYAGVVRRSHSDS